MTDTVAERARRAAEKWFAGTRTMIDDNRPQTGNSFADSAVAHLDWAVGRLAGIIAAEFTPATPSKDVRERARAIVNKAFCGRKIPADLSDIMEAITNAITSLVADQVQKERERAARVAEALRPTGGRMWTSEQYECFAALTDCAKYIRSPIDTEEVKETSEI